MRSPFKIGKSVLKSHVQTQISVRLILGSVVGLAVRTFVVN